MNPDASDLLLLARTLLLHLASLDGGAPSDVRRRKVIGAMAHLTPTGSLSLVPHVVDTVIEERETLDNILYSPTPTHS